MPIKRNDGEKTITGIRKAMLAMPEAKFQSPLCRYTTALAMIDHGNDRPWRLSSLNKMYGMFSNV
jgi:hypothetical protein